MSIGKSDFDTVRRVYLFSGLADEEYLEVIASRIGVKPETLSRLLHKLADQGCK